MTLPIGGFMPIPLAMMIPFMATQSMVMGDAFGRAFQYGKRKISAMSNEEFNKTSMEQQASQMFASYKNIIPTLTQSIEDSQTLQEKIIREMLLILPRFATSPELFNPEPFTVAGQTKIQDVFTGSPEATDAISNSIGSFFDSLTKINTAVSLAILPTAAATSDYFQSTQTFTQEQQDIQDNPPSNIPFVLQGMTKAQISNAYSDMLSGRITLTTKQKQELTLAFKSSSFEKSVPETFTEIPDPEPQEIKIYWQKKTDLLIAINQIAITLPALIRQSQASPRSVDRANAVTTTENKLAAARKLLLNHISLARNVRSTAAAANNDWNKRIWNL